MPKWQATNNKIRYNSRFRDNRVLFLAHNTVKYKLEFAFFHITVLHKAYNLQPTSAKTLLKRSMIENVILNLSSALDAIAHEINQINNFGIDFHRVAIDHKHRDQFYKYCMRCKLDQSSHHLSHYLNFELPQKTSESDATHWYFDFQKYRNQMVHRTIYVLMLDLERIFFQMIQRYSIHPHT